LNEFTQIYPVIKILKVFFCWINIRKFDPVKSRLNLGKIYLANHGQNLNRISAKLKLTHIWYTNNKPDFKLEFGQIRTRIIRSKTNLNEFKTNRIQIRPRLQPPPPHVCNFFRFNDKYPFFLVEKEFIIVFSLRDKIKNLSLNQVLPVL
jgi:hypothetical protein